MRKLILALAVALLGVGAAVGQAQANTITNVTTPSYFNVTPVGFGSFTDQYKFTLTTGQNFTVSIGVASLLVASLQVKLCDSDGVSNCHAVPKIGNFLFSLAGQTTTLAGQAYSLVIKGFGLGGGYAVGINSVQQAPIPPAILMFLTALGGMGFFGYRRNSRKAA